MDQSTYTITSIRQVGLRSKKTIHKIIDNIYDFTSLYNAPSKLNRTGYMLVPGDNKPMKLIQVDMVLKDEFRVEHIPNHIVISTFGTRNFGSVRAARMVIGELYGTHHDVAPSSQIYTGEFMADIDHA